MTPDPPAEAVQIVTGALPYSLGALAAPPPTDPAEQDAARADLARVADALGGGVLQVEQILVRISALVAVADAAREFVPAGEFPALDVALDVADGKVQ